MEQNQLPIILLHGWTEQTDRLGKLRASLEKRGHQIFMPALPGFAKTQPPSAVWGLNEYAEWVHQFLLDQQQVPKELTVVGHSFGGAVAVRLSVLYPETVRNLVLINASGIRTAKSRKVRLSYYLAPIGAKVFNSPFLRKFQDLARNSLYKIVGSSDYLQAQGIMKKVLKKVVQQDLRSTLPKVGCPTLLIWGEKDRITPLKEGKLFHQLIPNSKLQVIKGCNHVLPYNHPEEVAQIIQEFLKRWSPTGRARGT